MQLLVLLGVWLLPVGWSWTLEPVKKVLYIDSAFNYNDPELSILAACASGYNVINFAFYLDAPSTPGPFDLALSWQDDVPPATKNSTVEACHANNVALMVSYGGSTVHPYTKNATAIGITVANWVLANNLDGIDWDMEGFSPGMAYQSQTGAQNVQWLIDATKAARAVLGTNNKFISHAPQAPYFGPIGGNLWPGTTGGYAKVYESAAAEIDWFNVQFYNQGENCYTTEQGLFNNSLADCGDFPGTSVTEIASYGIPASKIVVGKYDPIDRGSSGYVAAATLGPWLLSHPNGGLMVWEWASIGQVTNFVNSTFATSQAPTPAPTPNSSATPTSNRTSAPSSTTDSANGAFEIAALAPLSCLFIASMYSILV